MAKTPVVTTPATYPATALENSDVELGTFSLQVLPTQKLTAKVTWAVAHDSVVRSEHQNAQYPQWSLACERTRRSHQPVRPAASKSRPSASWDEATGSVMTNSRR